MAENSLEMIQEPGERTAGAALSRGIARLYSQHTRLRAGTSGLPTWTSRELDTRLNEGEKLLVAGMANYGQSGVSELSASRRGDIRVGCDKFTR